MIRDAIKHKDQLYEIDLWVRSHSPPRKDRAGLPPQMICHEFNLPSLRVLRLYGGYTAQIIRGSFNEHQLGKSSPPIRRIRHPLQA